MRAMRWFIAGVLLAGAAAVAVVLHLKSTSTQAHEMVQNGAALVDVRTPEEYQAGHLPGAVNIPVDEISARASEIGSVTRPVVTYCHSGARSARAAATLRQLGFNDVVNLGPKAAW
jgi:phage shock protein E